MRKERVFLGTIILLHKNKSSYEGQSYSKISMVSTVPLNNTVNQI